MRNSRFARFSAVVLLLAGFAAGMTYTMSCGGGGDQNAFAQGSLAERHVLTTAPTNVQGPGGNAIFTTFTPLDPADVVLRVRVRGTYSTTYNNFFELTLSVSNGAGTLTYARESTTLPSDTDRPLLLSTSLSAATNVPGPGAPDGSYRIVLSAISGAPGTDVDFGACVLEVVTLRGVTVLDPSPWL